MSLGLWIAVAARTAGRIAAAIIAATMPGADFFYFAKAASISS